MSHSFITALPLLQHPVQNTYTFGKWNFNGHGDDPGGEAAIEGADKGDGVVVGVDEGHAVP